MQNKAKEKEKKIKIGNKVMAFGTFDLLHPGHLFYLNEAKKLGNYLVVVVSRDSNAEKTKGKKPLNSERIRLAKLRGLRVVDEAILGSHDDLLFHIRKIHPKAIALGYDQEAAGLGEKLLKEKISAKIVRIKPFCEKKYKSSILREKNSLRGN